MHLLASHLYFVDQEKNINHILEPQLLFFPHMHVYVYNDYILYKLYGWLDCIVMFS